MAKTSTFPNENAKIVIIYTPRRFIVAAAKEIRRMHRKQKKIRSAKS